MSKNVRLRDTNIKGSNIDRIESSQTMKANFTNRQIEKQWKIWNKQREVQEMLMGFGRHVNEYNRKAKWLTSLIYELPKIKDGEQIEKKKTQKS